MGVLKVYWYKPLILPGQCDSSNILWVVVTHYQLEFRWDEEVVAQSPGVCLPSLCPVFQLDK